MGRTAQQGQLDLLEQTRLSLDRLAQRERTELLARTVRLVRRGLQVPIQLLLDRLGLPVRQELLALTLL